MKQFNLAIIIFILFLNIVYTKNIYAQPVIFNTSVAEYVEIKLDEGQVVQDGQIVVFTPEAYKLSSKFNDKDMVGVVNLNPDIEVVVEEVAGEQFTPVAQSGIVKTLVSTSEGKVQWGIILQVLI